MLAAAPSSSSRDRRYDGFGRLATSSNNLSGSALTLSYQWDADGDRIQVTHPDGTYFTYDYDGLDRQTAIRENGSTAVATVTYDNQGRRSGDTRGSVATAYGYDAISRPTSLADDLAGTADDVTTTLAYSPANQIVTKTRSNAGYAWTGYTTVSRAYVANGLNQYTTAGPASFSYDANGNLTGDGTSTYSYDVENRLTGKSGGLAIAYDPAGRLWQTSGAASGTTRYLYDGDELVAEYDGGGTVLRRYVHGSGADDPQLWYEGAGLTDRRGLQIDQQGSIVSVANAAGSKLAILSYDEYGIPASGNIGRFQYTGQAWLPDLGAYYYKARMYSASLGRFFQTDPIGYADQNNLYAYVGNDPMNRTDPSGNQSIWERAGQVLEGTAEVIIGGAGMITGAAGDGASGAAEIGSGGLATPVAVPAAAGSTALIVVSAGVAGDGLRRIRNAFAPSGPTISENRGNRGGQGQGERGRAAKPSGTGNPGKHANPGAGYRTDPHTGKKIPLPPPPPPKPPEPEYVPKGKKPVND